MVSRTASIGFACRIGRPMATTQAFATWTPGPAVDSAYLLLVTKALAPEFDRLAYGSTHLTIYMPDIESMSMPLPPLPVQRAIADYLGRETARIDALIEAKRRMTELLAERERVTRSGIVSSSPDGTPYPRIRLKFLTPRIGVGLVINPSIYFSDEGVPFLHGSHITESGITFEPPKFMSKVDSASLPASQVRAGDVVVVRAGYPGRAVTVPAEFDGANCASIIIVRKSRKVVSDFLTEFLNGSDGSRQVALVQYGAAQEQINVSHVVDFLIPCPDVAEQRAALERIRHSCGPLYEARQQLLRLVGLLKERRQALVTAAVTGQLDIPEAA
jgi:type I restriction enzyme, S subunit